MVFIHDLSGECHFEYSSDGLVISFKGRNEHTDEVVDLCISQWAIESLHSAVLRSLDVILASQVSTFYPLSGTLTPGAE